jgi:hypothetical protein
MAAGDGLRRPFDELSFARIGPIYLWPMSQVLASRVLSLPLLAAGGAVAVLLAGTIVLWAHYGTAVFFETIRAGFVACFG